jgi:hypothetical protein
MRATLRFTVLLLACLGLAGMAGPAWAEYLVIEAGLQFPDKLGTATQVKGQRYPQPGLGHGIDYNGQTYGGSVYVYDRGAKDIADGIASGIVRSEFARARGDIAAIQKQQNQPEPQLVGERTVKIDGVEFLTATYRYTRNNVDTLSTVAVTGFRRHFVKLRVSTRASAGNEAAERIDGFVLAVGRFLVAAGPR